MIQTAANLPPLTSLRWCVATTKVGEEKIALGHLEDRARKRGVDLEVYLPMRLGHPRSRNPIQPLFPRHLFVRLDLVVGNYAFIWTTRGVQSVLMAGDHPGWIRDDRIADIRAREVDGLVTLDDAPIVKAKPVDPATVWPAEIGDGAEPPGEKWERGDQVVVADLPWSAVFSKHLGDSRAEVLVSVLGADSKPAKAIRNLSQLRRAPST